ncbi:hypothetical protein [Algibacter mikhailovii]|uniref:hypothetical protein n=1 Tax=Algibacter mikhailovii TaxID=425498 RepID=UPI00249512D9|nr:hypothetical protein [Algibacter mikhailovii]
MAKTLFVCYRNPKDEDFHTLGNNIAKRLEPDNVKASPPYIHATKNTFTLIYNPTPTIKVKDASVCLGMCEEVSEMIFEPNSSLPIGSYALFRDGKTHIEIATDYSASRTVWYYQNEDIFIATSSQRMAIAFLGDFQFNDKTCGWFLCSGNLGPGNSWDKRLNLLPPRTRILLNRKSWELKISNKSNFNFTEEKSIHQHNYKQQLREVVKSSIHNLNINPSQWTLALSGGMDSRSLLYHLQDKNLNSVTWGLKKALEYDSSDACIGKKLASITGIPHKYAELDYRKGNFSALIDRFTLAGEGRIDHLSGYFDALKFWGSQSASGRGIIRGYDAFGRKPPVKNEYQVRRACNLEIFDDKLGTAKIPEKYRICKDDIPIFLLRQENEALEDWRDRLWLQHRTPVTTASLEDIKLAYVEIVNPLLSKKIVEIIQSLPIELRNNKKIWRSITSEMFPKVPFAKREAVQEVSKIYNLPEVRDYICDYLRANLDSEIFSEPFLNQLIDSYGSDYKKESFRRGLRRFIIAYMPKKIENLIRGKMKSGFISHQRLAVRAFLILKVNEMYLADALVRKS